MFIKSGQYFSSFDNVFAAIRRNIYYVVNF